jgi:hypothetical protein
MSLSLFLNPRERARLAFLAVSLLLLAPDRGVGKEERKKGEQKNPVSNTKKRTRM